MTYSGALTHNKSLQLTLDSLLGLATPSPPIESNAAELRRYAQERIMRKILVILELLTGHPSFMFHIKLQDTHHLNFTVN